MNLEIVTICLDAWPMISWHLPVFNRLSIKWRWHVVEGVADNIRDTAWCKKMEPRLSRDGTTEYINSIRRHPRVRIYQQQLWPGKVSMFQHVANQIKEPCCLLEVDSDELWETWQIEKIVEQFDRLPTYNCARFDCVYMVGQNIRTVGRNCYGANAGEWLRAFRFAPGMEWRSHEPPFLAGVNGPHECCMSNETSRELGLVFWHYAYCFPAQVALKERYYGYANAGEFWARLQANTKWPTPLRKWLPWVQDDAIADLLHR